MATSFPTSLDSFTNPVSSDTLSSPSHAGQHTDLNDAVAALQVKVGADSSAVAASLDYKVAQLEAISHGKILQVVRATDATDRTTTSTSFVDATISVTITPTATTSNIMLIWTFIRFGNTGGSARRSVFQITDSSNVAISGAENVFVGPNDATDIRQHVTAIAFDSAATTSATTYKGRFKCNDGGLLTTIDNDQATGQLFALEVGA